LKGRRFEMIPDIKADVMKELKDIRKEACHLYCLTASGNTAGIGV